MDGRLHGEENAAKGTRIRLKGDPGVSNTDHYAKEKTADNNWVQTGPHVMILGDIGGMAKAYPRDAKADPTKPYVMWPGTAYEHLMLPID